MSFDLVVRNGRIITATDEFQADIAVAHGRIAAIGHGLGQGAQEIDATGMLVMPGGVDVHCHIDEPSYLGVRLADDFVSASRSAACGGTTTIVPFANQLQDHSLLESWQDYRVRAEASLIDYAFHLLLMAHDAELIRRELPQLLSQGLRAIKVFMTYPGYRMPDDLLLDIMAMVAKVDGIVMVHAESGLYADWNVERLARAGKTGLSHFRAAFPAAIERDAIHRVVTMSELTGARVMIMHVSSADGLEQIQWARRRGLNVHAETCPQYLVDFGDRLDRDDWEAAKYICSPPPRGGEDACALWEGLNNDSLAIISSDHCPYRFEGGDGKKSSGEASLRTVPPGLPGLETRLPLVFEEGVAKGRISASRFVELTSTKPAMTYGLYPLKGAIMPGADADMVLWEQGAPLPIGHHMLHDACDYTPFEGRRVSAWPATTLSRGERVWDRGWVSTAHGRGRFVGVELS